MNTDLDYPTTLDYSDLINLQAEQSLLGALMVDGDAIDRITGFDAEDFASEGHRTVAASIAKLAKAGKSIDIISVMDDLQAAGTLNDIGGMVYLNALVTSVGSAANIRSYAEIVKEKAVKRSVHEILSKSLPELKAADASVVVEDIISELDKVSIKQQGEREPVGTNECLNEIIEDIDNKKFGDNKSLIPTGINSVDMFFNGGLQRGDLIVVAGRPSMGKTALACSIGSSIAKAFKVTAFSMEMDKKQLSLRNLSAISGVPFKWLNSRDDGENDHYWSLLTIGMEDYKDRSFWIDDRTNLTINQIRNTCKKAKRKAGLDVMIIDYLTLMNIKGGKNTTRAQDIGEVTRQLKCLAKELDVAVILLHQLNRNVTDRQSKRPTMADLRDSGAVEQDADIIILIHREEYYEVEDFKNHTGHSEIIVDKYRNGERGVFDMTFRGTYCRFEDWDGRKSQKGGDKQYKSGFDDTRLFSDRTGQTVL